MRSKPIISLTVFSPVSRMKLLLFSGLTFVLSLAFAQAPRESTPAPASCNDTLQASQDPGVYNIVYDSELRFVYNSSSCTSTDQKIIALSWASQDCSHAIDALCGSASANNAVTGNWIWAFHTQNGGTCQAGLYQALGAGQSDVGFLGTDCCRQNFRAMLSLLTEQELDINQGNRLSVNLALGGFPHTETQYANGLTVQEDGMQMAVGYPSYILQGYDTFASRKSTICRSLITD